MAFGKETLKGLNGVLVVVEKMDHIEEDGLKRSSIESDVKQQLEMANIRVLTEDEYPSSPGLYILVDGVRNPEGLYAYKIRVGLYQNVLLERYAVQFEEHSVYIALTWESRGYVGLMHVEDLDFIRDRVKDEIDEFIRDYYLVNEEGLDEEELKKEQEKIEKDLKEMQKKGDKEPCHVQRLFYPDTGEYETRITALIDGELRTTTFSEEEMEEMRRENPYEE